MFVIHRCLAATWNSVNNTLGASIKYQINEELVDSFLKRLLSFKLPVEK